MQGIPVAPGVINADFEGEIEVMTHRNGISVVNKGKQLEQLVSLPKCKLEIELREVREEILDLVHPMPIGYKPQVHSNRNSLGL